MGAGSDSVFLVTASCNWLDACWVVRQVDVGDKEEAFAGVVTAALNVLLLGVETRLDAHLGLLMRTNWAAIESVRRQLSLLLRIVSPLFL